MPLQKSVTVQNSMLDALETAIGTSPFLQIRTGVPPANCAAADTGTLLMELALPADWLANAASGIKGRNGTWTGTGIAAGVAAHFRIKNNAKTATHLQGTVAQSSGGDLNLDNTNIAVGQVLNITTFNIDDGND